jgi:MFS family permease
VADSTSWLEHAVRGLGASTRHNALAYGFSLAMTGAFAVLTYAAPPTRPLEIFLFGLGGAASFTIANAATTRGFRKRVREEPPIVRAVGSSLGFVSVAGAIAIAWLVGWALGGWSAWLLGGFAASSVYLLLSALELATGGCCDRCSPRTIWPSLTRTRRTPSRSDQGWSSSSRQPPSRARVNLSRSCSRSSRCCQSSIASGSST